MHDHIFTYINLTLLIMKSKPSSVGVGGGGGGVRKGAWTQDEDLLLTNCIQKYGEGKWHQVPLKAGLNRCRKSCRLRWLNYLKPDIKRGEFADDEVDLLIRLHKLLGNRWSLIAGRIPGRTANDVKNYWNTHMQKKVTVTAAKHNNNKDNLHLTSRQTILIKPRPRTFASSTTTTTTSTTNLNQLHCSCSCSKGHNSNRPPPPELQKPSDDEVQWWDDLFDDKLETGWDHFNGSDDHQGEPLTPTTFWASAAQKLAADHSGQQDFSTDVNIWHLFNSD